MTPAQSRISYPRVLALVIAVALVALTARWFAARGLEKPASVTATSFAGYVDVTATPEYAFESPADTPQSHVLLAFVVAAPDDPCAPTWGTYYTLEAADRELDLSRRITQLRDIGGSVAVSFGGQANTELAVECSDEAALIAAYQSVIDHYRLDRIDLDLEGPALLDQASQQRRAAAIAALQNTAQSAGSTLGVWVTLPVDPNGLTAEGVAAVRTLVAGGVRLAGVNGMAMNYGASKVPDQSMSQAAVSATEALHGQVQSLLPGSSYAQVGMTVMVGQNDVAGETFTMDDASAVNAFAVQNGLGLLSIWSLNRDQTCQPPLPKTVPVVQTDCSGVNQNGLRFADVLADGAVSMSPSSTVSPATTTAQPDAVDDPATSPYPIWDPLGTYPGNTRVVWKREVYKARYWTTGVTPGAARPGEPDPWLLIGPVLPGDTPAPLPTLPRGTYPQWKPRMVYTAGDRVQLDQVAYEAKWWTKGQQPGDPVPGGSPWTLITPGAGAG